MSVAGSAVSRLRSSFGGAIILSDDDGYESARLGWSAQYDRRPALVARPVDAADVTAALRFAREQDLVVAVRGGGHSISGHSTSEGGMLLDLSALRGVSVDPEARIARVAGGTLLAELDRATVAHGLVCPSGTVGHTGVAGLTLGGGVGRLQRPFGLTLDNLVAAEVVTADGRHVRASETEHPDLYWALRGAGPNFGVVTAFEFRLHPFGPTLTRGVRVYRGSDAVAVWEAYRALLGNAPRELGLNFVIARAEEEETYPDDVRGGPIAIVAYNHPGSETDAAALLAPLAAAAEPIMENGGTLPYLEVQAMYDSAYGAGQRYYSVGGFANDLSAAVVRALVGLAAEADGEAGFSATGQGGAIADLDEADTAFTGRSAWLRVTADSTWTDPSADDAAVAWCRAAMAVVEPELVPGRYVNEVFEDGTDPAAIYGAEKAARLAAVKRAWDPDNVFRMNHNIAPAAQAETRGS